MFLWVHMYVYLEVHMTQSVLSTDTHSVYLCVCESVYVNMHRSVCQRVGMCGLFECVYILYISGLFWTGMYVCIHL